VNLFIKTSDKKTNTHTKKCILLGKLGLVQVYSV